MPGISLGEAVHRLMHAYKSLLREAIAKQEIELPVTQIRILKGICRSPRGTAQSIAQRMQRDNAQITRALNDLIGAGLIVRVDNPADGRSHFLKPTSSGRKIVAGLDAAEDWAVQQLTRNLQADDIALFLRVSNTMADSARQILAPDKGEP